MQSIVLLIFCFVSRSSLADLASRPVRICRSRWRCRGLVGDVSSYSTGKSAVHTSRTLKTFGCLSKESLIALWLRNNAAEADKYLFKWSPPSVRRQQEQAPWRPSEQTGEASRITTDMEPVPELGCELSILYFPNQGGLGELTVVQVQFCATWSFAQRERNEKTERRWSDRSFISGLPEASPARRKNRTQPARSS